MADASETLAAGVYDATTLSAIDADLTAAKIKSGQNIFGFAGTVVEKGTETLEKYFSADLPTNATYTPGDAGLFLLIPEGGSGCAVEYFSTGDAAWHNVSGVDGVYQGSAQCIGDGANFRIKSYVGPIREYMLWRQNCSAGTYERALDTDLAAVTASTPSSGFLSLAKEQAGGNARLESNYDTIGWATSYLTESAISRRVLCAISDGTNARVYNISGVSAVWVVVMRAKML